MKTQRTVSLAAATLLAGGIAISCGSPPPPDVPVYASPVDLTLLAGNWRGEYTALDGRRGHISFDLAPGRDEAVGEVYIFPAGATIRSGAVYGDESREIRQDPGPAPIPIEFVWTENGQVQGRLSPYTDPDTRATLRAEFRGTWTGETIRGRFAELDGGRTVREGWWRAVRTGGAAEGAPATLADVPPHEELVGLGRQVFETRGCLACHGGSAGTGDQPPALDAVSEHRTFEWIFHMVVYPDSMLRHDPTAMALGRTYQARMQDLDVTPWEALLLYEYLQERAVDAPARRD